MQQLIQAQLIALKAAFTAETDAAVVAARAAGNAQALADFYNGASTFIVWKTSITPVEMHAAYVWTEMDTFTVAKYQQLMLLLGPGRIDPSQANVRQGMLDIFAGAGLVNTRTALVALAKRAATKGERVFATGTGTTAVPGTMATDVEGEMTEREFTLALNS